MLRSPFELTAMSETMKALLLYDLTKACVGVLLAAVVCAVVAAWNTRKDGV